MLYESKITLKNYKEINLSKDFFMKEIVNLKLLIHIEGFIVPTKSLALT